MSDVCMIEPTKAVRVFIDGAMTTAAPPASPRSLPDVASRLIRFYGHWFLV